MPSTNAASIPPLPLSRKRARDKEESSKDDAHHFRNENDPGNQPAKGSADFVVHMKLAGKVAVSVSAHKERRGAVKSSNNDTVEYYLEATEKDVGSEDALVVEYRESYQGVIAAGAASHLMNLDSEQTSQNDGSTNKHSREASTSERPSNASGRQSKVFAGEDRLSELADYRRIHGHGNVPVRRSGNSKLAKWVTNQRQQYKLHRDGKTSSLTLSRIQKLEFLYLNVLSNSKMLMMSATNVFLDQFNESYRIKSKLLRRNEKSRFIIMMMTYFILSMDIDEVLPIARHKDSLGGRLFLKGNDGYTKCVVTKSTLEADANNFPPKHSKTFYLLAQLGTGKVGTTYLACNSSGRLCAVKMHIPERSVAATVADRDLEWNQRFIEKQSEVTQELSRWDALCESNPAFRVILCGNPCLVMPYGIEIPSDERTDTLVQAKIKDLLTTFAKKGFFYKELRWRHILRDYNNNLFLVDLESLKGLTDPDKSTRETWVAFVVKQQLDELLKKAATATPSRAEPEPDEDAVVLVEVAPATHKRKR
jgi:hypothetical protein